MANLAAALPPAAASPTASASAAVESKSQTALEPVEIVAKRTTYAKFFDNGDGTQTAEYTTEPVHFQDATGAWQEIDTRLLPSPREGYAFENASGPFTVLFSATANDGAMVRVEDGASVIEFGIEGASFSSQAIVDGNTIVYPGVLPGADLVYEVRSGGLKELVRLHSAPSEAPVFRFPMKLQAASIVEGSEGLTINADNGDVLFDIPSLWMADSAKDPQSGDAAFSEDVAAALDTSGAIPVLEVRPDLAWLQDPQRVFPVDVDPSFEKITTLDTYVQSNISNTAQDGATEMKSGTYDGGTTKARSLLKFAGVETDIAASATIDSATFQIYENHSFSCTASNVSVHRINASWSSGVVWSTQPGYVSTPIQTKAYAKGYSSSCPADHITFSVLDAVRYWRNNANTNYGLLIRAESETTSNGWKKYASSETAFNPKLIIQYTAADTVAPDVTNLSSSSHPTEADWYPRTAASLSWSGTDTGGSGVAGYSYVRDSAATTTPDTTSEGTGTTYSETLGQGIYYFHVRAKDGAGNWGSPKHYQLKVDSGAPGDPSISSSSHTRDACSTSANPSFSWSSTDATSGIQGYGTAWDQVSGTTPGTSSVSISTGGTFSASSDGDWWMHVRAKDKAGNLSGLSHYKVRINALAAAPPTIGTSSHADGVWSSNRSFNINWSLSDVFGVNGYSYVLDQSSGTIPDTTSEGLGTSYSTTISGDGTYYFHVRGLDGCGSWGNTRHYTVRVDDSPSGAPVVSSTSHPSDSTWYSDRTADLSYSASDVSSVDGYSHLVDGFSSTTPDAVSEGSGTSHTTISLGDGTHYFHVRARNGAGLWSAASHRGLKIDGTAPLGPTVSSSSHADALTDYPNNDPTLSWSAPSDLSGIAGYSYTIDQSSTTVPDTISEGLGVSKSYADLADGTYYFHIRALDVAGNWGDVTHRRVGVSVPAPHVFPTMTGPAGQLDADSQPVVKNGDLLTFGGRITEGTAVNASSDLAAVVSTCNLVVKDEAGAVVNTIAVPSSSCRNSGGNLVSSYAPTALGTAAGTVYLEVVVQRTAGGVTKSSGVQSSGSLRVDNITPHLDRAEVGCGEVPGLCRRATTLTVRLNEPVKGTFLASEFSASGNQVLSIQQSCDASTFCRDIRLNLASPMSGATLPHVSYAFASLPTRIRPMDGTSKSLPNSQVLAEDPAIESSYCSEDGSLATVTDPSEPSDQAAICGVADADDPVAPVVRQFAPEGEVIVVTANALQAVPTRSCPDLDAQEQGVRDREALENRIAELEAKEERTAEEEAELEAKKAELEALRKQQKQEKHCQDVRRQANFAKRVKVLSDDIQGKVDAMGFIPDVILLQEVKREDVEDIIGFLEGKILTPLKKKNGDNKRVDFRIARPLRSGDPYRSDGSDSNQDGAPDTATLSDTAIIYNYLTVRRLEKDFDGDGDVERDVGAYVQTEYGTLDMPTEAECEEPEALVELLDPELGGLDPCLTRIGRRHFYMGFQGDGLNKADELTFAAASTHWAPPSAIREDPTPETQSTGTTINSDDYRGNLAVGWADQMAAKFDERYSDVDLHVFGGDLNIERCVRPEAEPDGRRDPEPKERFNCTTQAWWNRTTTPRLVTPLPAPTGGHAFADQIQIEHGESDQSLQAQYDDGEQNERNLRIDILFARHGGPAPSPADPVASSHDLSCGEGHDSLPANRQNCEWYVNRERYSDHRLLWTRLAGPVT